MSYYNFDAKEVSVVINGMFPIHGFADGTFIEVSFENSLFNTSSDIHGNITRVRVNKDEATITLNLSQVSSSNDTLSAFYEADRLNGSGVFSIVIKDNNSNTLFTSLAAYIHQTPKISFSNDTQVREWTIKATKTSRFISGAKK